MFQVDPQIVVFSIVIAALLILVLLGILVGQGLERRRRSMASREERIETIVSEIEELLLDDEEFVEELEEAFIEAMDEFKTVVKSILNKGESNDKTTT